MGFEPTTPTLARLCSTPELHPHPIQAAAQRPLGFLGQSARLCNRQRDGTERWGFAKGLQAGACEGHELAAALTPSGERRLAGPRAIRLRPTVPALLSSSPAAPPMSATPDDLFAFLDRLGIAHRTVTHPPLFTVEQSRVLRGAIPGGHTKNLFLRDKRDTLFLVVALEDAAIDLKSLHRRLGSGRFSFGSAELLREVWGVEPGSVTPFGAINDTARRVAVVLDAAMMQHDTLNYHPLVNTMTTAIGRDDLVRFLAATGHPPRILPVSGAPGGAPTA